MNDRPDAPELLRAVERWLEQEVVPTLAGPARFHARVAANVVAVVAREIETQEDHLMAEWKRLGALLGDAAAPPERLTALQRGVWDRNAELVRRIRAGELDPGDRTLLAHLRETVAAKLAVSRPPRQGRERAR